MASGRLFIRKLINVLQSLLILGMMVAIFAVIGLMVAGKLGLLVAILAGAMIFLMSPRLSPAMVLRSYNARQLLPEEVPGLYHVLGILSERAGLNSVPTVYYVPSSIMNAFTVGRRDRAAIVVTDGLLRSMTREEMTGILAHEVSHVEHNDLWVMGLADAISRFTNIFSTVGFIMVALYFPLILLGGAEIPFWAIGILVLAPYATVLLQLALSRTREYDADLNAVKLTGDPRGLAVALEKLEHYPMRIRDLIFMPGRRVPGPSVLRTHPHTRKRIVKLMELAGKNNNHGARADFGNAIGFSNGGAEQILPGHYSTVTRKPRWRLGGTWH
ncbi:MAG: M48 family metalloprotease [Spirochaetes bacterium]|nr:M48 family metalloprotease [Spirochaetota bacterium]